MKAHILYVSIYMKCSEWANPQKWSRWVVTRGWQAREGDCDSWWAWGIFLDLCCIKSCIHSTEKGRKKYPATIWKILLFWMLRVERINVSQIEGRIFRDSLRNPVLICRLAPSSLSDVAGQRTSTWEALTCGATELPSRVGRRDPCISVLRPFRHSIRFLLLL